MEIIKYNLCNDIRIKFLDEHGFEMDNTYGNFSKGTIKNPYDRYIWGHGYIGVGKYKTHNERTATKEYQVWNGMMARCYSEKQRHTHSSYEGCSIGDDWHNFQIFSEWLNENIYTLPNNERVELDKDILFKGNKIYSPETCVFVPKSINLLFVNRKSCRGDLPLGVNHNNNGSFIATYGHDGKATHLGTFETKEEAFQAFKLHKEAHVKVMAERYKKYIPQKLYNALYRYSFEITD